MSEKGIDVAGLVPEAREIVAHVAESYRRHTFPWFIGLLAHGSSVKGGFIPGCSDVDLHLFLEDEAFSWHDQLPLDIAFQIRTDLLRLDPSPFRYVQCYPQSTRVPKGWLGPIPGAYHMVAGELPIPEATATDLLDSAAAALTALHPNPRLVVNSLLGRGGGRFPRNIRLLCTEVWPVVYQVLTLASSDPVSVWSLTKTEAVRQLPSKAGLTARAEEFLDALNSYYPNEESLTDAHALIDNGIAFLEEVQIWWNLKSAAELQIR